MPDDCGEVCNNWLAYHEAVMSLYYQRRTMDGAILLCFMVRFVQVSTLQQQMFKRDTVIETACLESKKPFYSIHATYLGYTSW